MINKAIDYFFNEFLLGKKLFLRFDLIRNQVQIPLDQVGSMHPLFTFYKHNP